MEKNYIQELTDCFRSWEKNKPLENLEETFLLLSKSGYGELTFDNNGNIINNIIDIQKIINAPVIEDLAVQFDGKAKICKIDTDSEKELTTKFSIRSIPLFSQSFFWEKHPNGLICFI